LYNSSVQNCQNYARSVPHAFGHEPLDDDVIENVKPHILRLHGNMSLYSC